MDFPKLPSNRALISLGLFGALILGACAGESAETLQAALDAPAGGLAYVDDSESSCVSTAVVSTIGFEELVQSGFTSETIAQNADESLAQILEMGDGADVREAVKSCLDTDRIARAQLTEFSGEDLVCEADFAGSELSDTMMQLAFDGENLEEVADTSDNRDLLRPCFTEVGFAETFGLDTREELEQAIEATFGSDLRTDGELCAAPLLIDYFGSAEGANDAGITVESPEIDLDDLDVGATDRSSLFSSIVSCSSVSDIFEAEMVTSEPTYADCMVEHFNEEFNLTWRKSHVQMALGIAAAADTSDRQFNSAMTSCVSTRINDVYGAVETAAITEAWLIADDLYGFIVAEEPLSLTFAYTRADMHCAAVEVVREVDVQRMSELTVQEGFGEPSDELLNLGFEYADAFQRGYDKCALDPLYALVPALQRNFSADTVACSRREIGDPAALLESFASLDGDFTLTDSEYFSQLAILQEQVLGPIENCLGRDEVATFDSWMTWWYGDSEFGEPDWLTA